jgi:hypothetical protein
MGDLREVYKRVAKNDWVLTKMKDIEVGSIISIHDGGKGIGIFKTTGPPYMNSEGFWTVSVDRLSQEQCKEVKEGV